MLNGNRLKVLIAHAHPLVAAGLEATLRAGEEFRVTGRRELEGSTKRSSVSIAVTDYKCGTNPLSSQPR
jgi:DNA-binding NarL/FixJ family response regulator